MVDAIRDALERLAQERGEDFAGLSRLIGRNPSYIHQFVRRGSPRRLAEDDRRTLAAYFGVPEARLGGPEEPVRDPDVVAVPRRRLGASAGPGSLDEDERARGALPMPSALLRELGAGALGGLSVIKVVGDSMLPGLADGDDILVDAGKDATVLRDGVYVLRVEGALLVKRIALRPDGNLAVSSDNPAYPSWPDLDRAGVGIVGRVLWAGRRVR